MFGYDKLSSDRQALKLVGKGTGGVEELFEELADAEGKILYALCDVFDDDKTISRIMLINWVWLTFVLAESLFWR